MLKERVSEVCRYKSNSIRNFANIINMSANTISQQIRGERAISIDVVSAILNTFDEISAEWLMRGAGEMIKKDTNTAVNTDASNSHIIIMELIKNNQNLHTEIADARAELTDVRAELAKVLEQKAQLEREVKSLASVVSSSRIADAG